MDLHLALVEENSYVVARNADGTNFDVPFKEQNLIVLDLSCPNSPEILLKVRNGSLGAFFRCFKHIFRPTS